MILLCLWHYLVNRFKNSGFIWYDISYAINSRSFFVEKVSLFCEIDKFYPVCCCHCLELFWPHYLRLDWSWKIETRSPLWHINTKIAVVAAENDLLYYSSLLFYCLAIIFLSFVESTMVELNMILNLSSISIGTELLSTLVLWNRLLFIDISYSVIMQYRYGKTVKRFQQTLQINQICIHSAKMNRLLP